MPPPPPNFDPVARIYRWVEYLTLGPLLQHTRTHFLPRLSLCRQAYALGDGDGRFLAQLLQQNREVRATAVDTSVAMLTLLRSRCERTSPTTPARLTTLQASALEAQPPPATDLIVTHFFLDCFSQPEVDRLTRQIAAQVQPGTLWLLSDFALPRHSILRPLAALYLRALYLSFRILTGLRVTHLPDPQQSLTAAGFERIAHHQRLGGLLYTQLWLKSPTA
jgi:hypothetical protein